MRSRVLDFQNRAARFAQRDAWLLLDAVVVVPRPQGYCLNYVILRLKLRTLAVYTRPWTLEATRTMKPRHAGRPRTRELVSDGAALRP